MTNTWTITFWTNQWVSSASFNSNWDLHVDNFYNISQWDYTVNVWAYKPTQPWTADKYIYFMWDWSTRWWSSILEYDNSRLRFAMWYDDLDASVNPWNQRVNIWITYEKSTKRQTIYVNWQQKWTRIAAYTHSLPNLTLYIWWKVLSWGDDRWTWFLSRVIFEKKLWNLSDFENYYTKTKSKYWY